MDLIIDIQNRIICQSITNARQRTMPPLFLYEKVPLSIYLMKPTDDPSAPLVTTEDGGWNIVAALCGGNGIPVGTEEGDPITKTTSFTYDGTNHCFNGTLDMTQDAVKTFVGANSKAQTTLEVQYLDGAKLYICCQTLVTVNAIVCPPTS